MTDRAQNGQAGLDAGLNGADSSSSDSGGDDRTRVAAWGRNGGTREDHRGLDRVTPIPSSIVQAICQIMSSVDAVKKSQINQHGSYKYASTDDIYAATTRKMGEVGLLVMSLEDKCEIKRIERDNKTSQWAHMEFSFVLATTRDTWTDARAKRTLYIQVTGAQTFQAAQSYAEKAYLRSLFKLPTGDMDLDSMPQAETEEEQAELSKPRKAKSSAAAKRDGTEQVFNDLMGAVSGADGPADLADIKRRNFSVWESMPHRWKELLDDEFTQKMKDFETESA